MKNCLGIINLSEEEMQIQELTSVRPIAGLPFAGRYRVIDFMLSNMVNGGIHNIGIFTQSKFRSLIDHIGSGKAWDLDRKITGVSVFNPAFNYNKIVQTHGDIEHFYQSLDYIKYASEDYVFLSRSYMICNMDLKKAFAEHLESKNDISIIYKKVKNEEKFYGLDTLNIGMNKLLISIGKNTGKKEKIDLSMEMYIMRKDILVRIIEESVESGNSNYLKQALFQELVNYKVGTCKYDGYLACINSNKNFYDANMDMLDMDIYKQLFNNERPVFTKVKDEPSTIYRENSDVKNSLVANGCDIEGEVKNSIIFRDVHIAEGTKVTNSIIMQRTKIEKNCSLNNVILDKYVVISKENILAGDKKIPYIVGKNLTI